MLAGGRVGALFQGSAIQSEPLPRGLVPSLVGAMAEKTYGAAGRWPEGCGGVCSVSRIFGMMKIQGWLPFMPRETCKSPRFMILPALIQSPTRMPVSAGKRESPLSALVVSQQLKALVS